MGTMEYNPIVYAQIGMREDSKRISAVFATDNKVRRDKRNYDNPTEVEASRIANKKKQEAFKRNNPFECYGIDLTNRLWNAWVILNASEGREVVFVCGIAITGEKELLQAYDNLKGEVRELETVRKKVMMVEQAVRA